MGQRIFFDENDLLGQFKRMNETLLNMLEFAWIHEDKIITIESLMSRWAVTEISTQRFKVEWNKNKSLRNAYSDFDDFLGLDWWRNEFEFVDDQIKKSLIERFRLTIDICLFSNTYDEETLWKIIEKSNK